MCHKSVQTAVGKLHSAADMAGEEDPTGGKHGREEDPAGQSARALGSDADRF